MSTIFTKIIRHEVPSDIIYQDDSVTAFKDINPQAPIHILIVTNKEIESVARSADDDEQVMGHLFTVARTIARDLGVGDKGYRLIVNVGNDGGQEVPHLHMHLLAGTRLGRMLGS